MNENIMQTQINQILEIVKSHDNRFNAIEGRFNEIEEQIDERFDVLSEQIRQLDKQHGERLAKLETMVSQHDNQIGKLADRVDSMYKWVIGLIIGLLLPMWASIIIAILLK
jgi:tetrahydromethanopterin S-methyltransferase subunit G